MLKQYIYSLLQETVKTKTLCKLCATSLHNIAASGIVSQLPVAIVSQPVAIVPQPVAIVPQPVAIVPQPVAIVPQPVAIVQSSFSVAIVPQPVAIVPQPVAIVPAASGNSSAASGNKFRKASSNSSAASSNSSAASYAFHYLLRSPVGVSAPSAVGYWIRVSEPLGWTRRDCSVCESLGWTLRRDCCWCAVADCLTSSHLSLSQAKWPTDSLASRGVTRFWKVGGGRKSRGKLDFFFLPSHFFISAPPEIKKLGGQCPLSFKTGGSLYTNGTPILKTVGGGGVRPPPRLLHSWSLIIIDQYIFL